MYYRKKKLIYLDRSKRRPLVSVGSEALHQSVVLHFGARKKEVVSKTGNIDTVNEQISKRATSFEIRSEKLMIDDSIRTESTIRYRG